jgi:uncharacterized hydrophobic protein (TIGR00271 family)
MSSLTSVISASNATGPSQLDRRQLSFLGRSRKRRMKATLLTPLYGKKLRNAPPKALNCRGGFVLFMIIAVITAAVGIYLNSAILIISAMIVGPDFGPIAGVCVAVVHRRFREAGKSLLALFVGYALGIIAAYLMTVVLRETGFIPQHFDAVNGSVQASIAQPGFLPVLIALLAGIVGMLSLTTAKSGALIGVLVSVTTIPAAANIAVTVA